MACGMCFVSQAAMRSRSIAQPKIQVVTHANPRYLRHGNPLLSPPLSSSPLLQQPHTHTHTHNNVPTMWLQHELPTNKSANSQKLGGLVCRCGHAMTRNMPAKAITTKPTALSTDIDNRAHATMLLPGKEWNESLLLILYGS